MDTTPGRYFTANATYAIMLIMAQYVAQLTYHVLIPNVIRLGMTNNDDTFVLRQ